jgi:hypothetical protein
MNLIRPALKFVSANVMARSSNEDLFMTGMIGNILIVHRVSKFASVNVMAQSNNEAHSMTGIIGYAKVATSVRKFERVNAAMTRKKLPALTIGMSGAETNAPVCGVMQLT